MKKIINFIKSIFITIKNSLTDIVMLLRKRSIKDIKSKNVQEKKRFVLGLIYLVFIILLILFLIGIIFGEESTTCKKLKNGFYTCSDVLKEEYDSNNNLTNYIYVDSLGKKNIYKYKYKYDEKRRPIYIKENYNGEDLGYATAKYDNEGFLKQLNYNDTVVYDYYYEDCRTNSIDVRDNHVLKKVVESVNDEEQTVTFFSRNSVNNVSWTSQGTYNLKKEEVTDVIVYLDEFVSNKYNSAFEVFRFLPGDLWIGEMSNYKTLYQYTMMPMLTSPSTFENTSNAIYFENNVTKTKIYLNAKNYAREITDNESMHSYKYDLSHKRLEFYELSDLGEKGCNGLENCNRYTETHSKFVDRDSIQYHRITLTKSQYERKLKEYEEADANTEDAEYHYFNVKVDEIYGTTYKTIVESAKQSVHSMYKEDLFNEKLYEDSVKKDNNSLASDNLSKQTQNEYSYQELMKKLQSTDNAGDKEIVFLVSKDFDDTKNVLDVLQRVHDNYNIKISSFNIDDISDAEVKELISIIYSDFEENDRPQELSPILIHLNGGVVFYKTFKGEFTYDFYVANLISNMFIENN